MAFLLVFKKEVTEIDNCDHKSQEKNVKAHHCVTSYDFSYPEHLLKLQRLGKHLGLSLLYDHISDQEYSVLCGYHNSL